MNDPDHQTEARRWRQYAVEDLDGAKKLLETTGVARLACWMAQQAAEKALKALLVSQRIEHPRCHDLDLLWNLLPESVRYGAGALDLSELTEWAVEARYPGDWPEASPEDAHRAIETSDRVVSFVSKTLGM